MTTLDIESFGRSTNAADYAPKPFSAPLSGLLANGPFGDPAGIFLDAPYTYRTIPSGRVVGFVGFRFMYHPTAPSNLDFVVKDNSGVTQLTLRCDPATNRIIVYRGDATGTALYTSPSNLTQASVWQYLEFGFILSTTTGTLAVRLNGIQLTSQSSLNTQGSAAGSVDRVGWAGSGYVTHFYYNDGVGASPQNGFMGDVRVVALRPTGAGASTQFTPTGAATNWQVAATNPPAPATKHNDSATVGATDLFTVGALPAGLGQVFGVRVCVQASKTDAGTRTMATKLRSGSTTATSGSNVMLATPVYMQDSVRQVDPATNAAWTQAAVNASQIGYAVIA